MNQSVSQQQVQNKVNIAEEGIKDKLNTVVLQAIGQASMCWAFPERAGVFQTENAVSVGNQLLGEISKIFAEKLTEIYENEMNKKGVGAKDPTG